MSPWLAGFAGIAYAVTSTVSGAAMIALAWRLWRERDRGSDQAARHLFAFSILYLFLLFAVLLGEQGFGGTVRLIGALG